MPAPAAPAAPTPVPPPPAAAPALAVERAREQAEAVLQRLLARFAAETRLPADAHTPVRDAAFHQWLGAVSGMLPGKLDWVRSELADLALIPATEGRTRLCIALRGDEPIVGLVLADPFDRATRLWIEARLRAAGRPRTRWYVAPANQVLAFYDRVEQDLASPSLVPADAEFMRVDGDPLPPRPALSPAALPAAGSPALAAPPRVEVEPPSLDNAARRFVDQVLQDALAEGASDVQLSSTAEGLLVRYRIDGLLQVVNGADGRDFAARAFRRLKQLADLDPAASGLLDGRLALAHDEREVQAELSLLPGRHGDDAVLRIGAARGMVPAAGLRVAALGFDSAAADAMRRLARAPHGLLLVSGPGGSGRTTTLYGLLGEQPPDCDRLITLEDPIAAPLPDTLQIAIDAARGPGWAPTLRAALRHDADRILIDGPLDGATARLAVQAALGGRRLFAALPTGPAAAEGAGGAAWAAMAQLEALGVDPRDLGAALTGVIAQRLLRKICPHCAEPTQPDAALLAASDLPEALREPSPADGWTWRRGRGCPACQGSGYLGWLPIAQVLTPDARLRGLIARRAPAAELRAAAEGSGLTRLHDAALELVRRGVTTLEEAHRVTAVDD